MLKRILLGLGGTPYSASEIQFAVQLASAHHAHLTAATVMDLARISDIGPVPLGAAAAAASLTQFRLEQARTAIRAALDQVSAASASAGIQYSLSQEVGDPERELLDLWRYHDLTILALQSLFEYGVVHDPLDMVSRIVRRGVRPVLAVPQAHRPVRKVLLAYDGSTHAAAAMQRFVQLRPFGPVELEIACFHFAPEKAQPVLHDSRDYCRLHGFSVSTSLVPDHPRDALLPYARQTGADLIVMGAGEHGRVISHLIGSCVLHALQHSHVPIFLSL